MQQNNEKKTKNKKGYNASEAEQKWVEQWQKSSVYSFNPDSDKPVFSIDTPPPTVSGKMHIGHAFSYTQLDFIARYKRMRGFNVFLPFGTDDNGIATERLIEKMHNIQATKMSRDSFTKLCLESLDKIRPDFVNDWKRIGMSCDFSIFYSTINEHCRKISQKSFIELYKAGREYRKDAPALYCPNCRTAISQVECEDKELDSFFNDIIFKIDGEDVIIATTRPEYLAACVALFYYPDDERYKKYKGKKAVVPIFEHKVPVLADTRVDPEKGSGIVMCCTFGDQTDMEWYFAYDLPLRELIDGSGKLTKIAGSYEGMTIREAREEIIKELKEKGLLIRQKPIKHSVKVHERCGQEIEIIHTKQWFIKYLDLREEMLSWGSELRWFPRHMKTRYDNWIKGLQWDWLISRQRFHGIPFPVWYCGHCDNVIVASEHQLPVDPIKDKPPVDSCPSCGSKDFVPETDVLDTWATSSLTPLITKELFKGTKAYDKLFPMSLRPQAHDIITFWLFNTVVKSRLHYDKNPWKDVVISGHALDPKGRKMSKSRGNVVDPAKMVEKYSADALRFWSAGSKLGDDLPFQEKDLVTGQKFITKLWNASRFCFMHLEDFKKAGNKPKMPESLNYIDAWLLSKLNNLIKEATESFEAYEFSKTKHEAEKFFWHVFCDYYLELVKDRLYNRESYEDSELDSAFFTLYYSLLSIIKLFAPIMPFITEEVYSMFFKDFEQKGSVHLLSWPAYRQELDNKLAEELGELVVSALSSIRKAKTEKSLSLKSPVRYMLLKSKIRKADFGLVSKDLMAAGKIEKLDYEELDEGSKAGYEHIIEL